MNTLSNIQTIHLNEAIPDLTGFHFNENCSECHMLDRIVRIRRGTKQEMWLSNTMWWCQDVKSCRDQDQEKKKKKWDGTHICNCSYPCKSVNHVWGDGFQINIKTLEFLSTACWTCPVTKESWSDSSCWSSQANSNRYLHCLALSAILLPRSPTFNLAAKTVATFWQNTKLDR